jgi:hypothetical protein
VLLLLLQLGLLLPLRLMLLHVVLLRLLLADNAKLWVVHQHHVIKVFFRLQFCAIQIFSAVFTVRSPASPNSTSSSSSSSFISKSAPMPILM